MIINIYQELSRCKNLQEIEITINRIGCTALFEQVNKYYPELYYEVVSYIIAVYSYDSSLISLEEDIIEQQKNIAIRYNIPEKVLPEILNLEKIGEVVNEYLTKQGYTEYKHLQTLKYLYSRLISSIYVVKGVKNDTNDEDEKNDDIDYEQKVKNMLHAKKLRDDINEFEQAMRKKLGSKWVDFKDETQKELAEKIIEKPLEGASLTVENVLK